MMNIANMVALLTEAMTTDGEEVRSRVLKEAMNARYDARTKVSLPTPDGGTLELLRHADEWFVGSETVGMCSDALVNRLRQVYGKDARVLKVKELLERAMSGADGESAEAAYRHAIKMVDDKMTPFSLVLPMEDGSKLALTYSTGIWLSPDKNQWSTHTLVDFLRNERFRIRRDKLRDLLVKAVASGDAGDTEAAFRQACVVDDDPLGRKPYEMTITLSGGTMVELTRKGCCWKHPGLEPNCGTHSLVRELRRWADLPLTRLLQAGLEVSGVDEVVITLGCGQHAARMKRAGGEWLVEACGNDAVKGEPGTAMEVADLLTAWVRRHGERTAKRKAFGARLKRGTSMLLNTLPNIVAGDAGGEALKDAAPGYYAEFDDFRVERNSHPTNHWDVYRNGRVYRTEEGLFSVTGATGLTDGDLAYLLPSLLAC